MAFTPVYLWLATGEEIFREPLIVGPWMALIAVLMISNMATFSWNSLRPRRSIRLEVIFIFGLVFAALLTEPWWTLAIICIGYIALMPIALMRYGRIKRQRASVPSSE